MVKRIVGSLLAVVFLLAPVVPSYAERHGGHGLPGPPPIPGGPRFPDHDRFHEHRFHGDGVIVVGPSVWWDPWWDYPPYYYPPPQVIVEPAPVIVEQQPAESYWYYCPSAKAYYPTAPTCPEAWVKVPPRAQ